MIIEVFHKLSKAFIGVIGSLALIYYLLFTAYYWNIFGQNILPGFIIKSWQTLALYFDLYLIQNVDHYVIQVIQGWCGSVRCGTRLWSSKTAIHSTIAAKLLHEAVRTEVEILEDLLPAQWSVDVRYELAG